jgi:hypothetical protein
VAGPEEELAPEIFPAKKVAAPKPREKAPLVTQAGSNDDGIRHLIIAKPSAGAAKVITINQPLRVSLEGQPLIIPAGTVTTYKSLEDGILTFFANDREVQVNTDDIDDKAIKFHGPSQEKPEQLEAVFHAEAMRRYPALAVDGSKENILFGVRWREMKLDVQMRDSLKDPRWPLNLAEQLAAHEGWVRADLKREDGEAAPADTEPAEELAAPEGDPAKPLTPDEEEAAAYLRQLEAREALKKKPAPPVEDNDLPANLPPIPTDLPADPPQAAPPPVLPAPGTAPVKPATPADAPPVAKRVQ